MWMRQVHDYFNAEYGSEMEGVWESEKQNMTLIITKKLSLTCLASFET